MVIIREDFIKQFIKKLHSDGYNNINEINYDEFRYYLDMDIVENENKNRLFDYTKRWDILLKIIQQYTSSKNYFFNKNKNIARVVK